MSDLGSPLPEQPLRFGEMLIASFRYLRRNPGATLGVGALLATASSAVTGIVIDGVLLGGSRSSEFTALLAGETLTAEQVRRASDSIAAAAPYLVLAAVVAIVVQLLGMGLMTQGMVRAMRGEQVRAGELWSQVPWSRIVSINLLVGLLLLVAVGVPTVAAVTSGSSGFEIAAFAFASGFALIISVVSTLAVPAAVIEDLGARAALRRALTVTRRLLLRATAIMLGSLIFWDAVAGLVATPIGGIVGALAGAPGNASGTALQSLVSGIVSGAIILPATAAMAVLLYVDLVRRGSAAPQ